MSESKDLFSLRREYDAEHLYESSAAEDPFAQFKAWFDDVLQSDAMDPNAFFLATADAAGKPTVRTVLLKEYSPKGFVFFTNYNSRKGQDIKVNPFACLLFYWDFKSRQVRIEGKVEKISAKESDQYFYSRPLESQIGAIASDQSAVIPDRASLERKVKMVAQSNEIKRPDHWGGYIIVPKQFEFWQGQTNRLHDRLVYSLDQNGEWLIQRLAP